MSRTEIKVDEAVISNSTAGEHSSGEIAIMLETTRGDSGKVYRITDIKSFDRIFGTGLSGKKAFKYARWLLSKGHCLQAVRVGNGGAKAYVDLLTDGEVTPETKLTVHALGAGTGYNSLFVKLTPNSDGTFALGVYDGNPSSTAVVANEIEHFDALSLDENSPVYFGSVLDSDIIKLVLTGTGSLELTSVSAQLANGTDGPESGQYDGWAVAEALLAEQDCLFSLLLIPDCFGEDAASKALPIVSAKECVVFIPECLDPNASVYTVSAFKSSLASVKTAMKAGADDYSEFCASPFPFCKVSSLPGNIPASLRLASLYAKLHEKKRWYIPGAGTTEGLLNDVVDLGLSLTGAEIAELQEAGAIPVVNKIGYGPVVWFESTLGTNRSDVKDLHARFLINYLKRLAYEISTKYMFALHNEATWNLWKSEFEPFIRDIYNAGGIDGNYSVIMDKSVMSDEDITNGILRGKISFKPVSCIKQIYISFAITKTGITLEEGE